MVTSHKLKAQLFTLDMMLALIPLTIALGVSASAISGLSSQILSFSYFYSTEQVAVSAVDTLIKTPGDPPDWNQSYIPEFKSIGLAQHSYIEIYRDTRTVSNALDRYKLVALHLNRSNPHIIEAMKKLAGGKNIAIISESPDAELNFSVAWYKQSNGSWATTDNSAEIKKMISNARSAFSITRVVRSITKTLETAEFIWNYTGTDIVQSSPAIGDIDCDGENEIVIATNSPPGGTMALEGNGSLIWFYPTGKAYTSSPALVDLDGDCGLEIIIGQNECSGESGCTPANVTALDSDGTVIWTFLMGDATWNAPAVADVDYDGEIEVVVGSMPNDHNMYCLNGKTGSVEWSYSSCNLPDGTCDKTDRYKGGMAIAELDGIAANGMEIVAGNCNQFIHAIHGKDGSLYWAYKLPKHIHSTPAVADINNDGKYEIIVADTGSGIYVFYYNGTLMWSDPNGASDKSSPAVADLDDNPSNGLEIVIGTKNGHVIAYYSNGTIFWDYDTAVDYGSSIKIQSSPAIADIDDDCKLEVVIGSGGEGDTTSTTYIYAFNGEDGSVLWKAEATGSIVSSPAIGDLNGDGDMEIVVGSDSGNVYTFDVTGYGDAWPSFHQAEYFMDEHNIRRRGEWGGSVCGAPSGGYYSIEVRSRVTATITVVVWE